MLPNGEFRFLFLKQITFQLNNLQCKKGHFIFLYFFWEWGGGRGVGVDGV